MFCWSVLLVCSVGLFCWYVLLVCSIGLFCWCVLLICSVGLFYWSVLLVCSAVMHFDVIFVKDMIYIFMIYVIIMKCKNNLFVKL